MFFWKAAWCRIFQGAFRLALPVLPYREPEIATEVDVGLLFAMTGNSVKSNFAICQAKIKSTVKKPNRSEVP